MIRDCRRTACSVLVLLALLLFPGFLSSAFATEPAALNKDEAKKVLQIIIPDVQVHSVAPAPIKGLWEVIIETRGRKNIVYLDDARRNLVSGSVIDILTRSNLTKAKFDEINKVDFSSIPLDDALVMGDPKAKHKVVVFDDPD